MLALDRGGSTHPGQLAATLLKRRIKRGSKEPMAYRRLPYLIPLNAQSTWLEPAKSRYEEIFDLDREFDTCLSFCMAFPASDIAECAPMVWGYGERAEAAVQRLGETNEKPVVIADTQDNPGAGGDSNTTGLLRALLEKGAGKRLPGKVALGLLFDSATATMAHEAGLGASITTAIGTAVPTFTGQLSDAPVQGTFKVKALSDGKVTLKGPMMTGSRITLGPCALLEIEGVLVAVASGKKQLLDRELFRMLGVHPETMKVLVVKSSNHFRADFTPIASHILVAKAAGPMAADPADLPWTKLAKTTRTTP